MREANDRGFECVLLEDCTASYFPELKAATIAMVEAQGGIVGYVAQSGELIDELPRTRNPGHGQFQGSTDCWISQIVGFQGLLDFTDCWISWIVGFHGFLDFTDFWVSLIPP